MPVLAQFKFDRRANTGTFPGGPQKVVVRLDLLVEVAQRTPCTFRSCDLVEEALTQRVEEVPIGCELPRVPAIK